MKLRKKLFLIYFLPLFLLITVSIIYSVLTEEAILKGEELVKCQFKNRFGLYCPGCGGSRALIALLKFDFLESFILFPALLIAVLILLSLYIRVFISFIKNDEKYVRGFRLNLLIIIPIVMIFYFFLRNFLLLAFEIDLIGDFI